MAVESAVPQVVTGTIDITWQEFYRLIQDMARKLETLNPVGVYGVPQGGVPVAMALSKEAGLPHVSEPLPGVLVVDDIIDSGKTYEQYKNSSFQALVSKNRNHDALAVMSTPVRQWVKFPWEKEAAPEDAVIRLLQHIGEDPKREGLLDTPKRVLKALKEMTVGYSQTADEVLSTMFEDRCDELVILKDISFVSMCEHHMLPFSGVAHVGYLPGDKVVGLSKLARLTEMYARRLQVQERMTQQIAGALMDNLDARGAAVVVEAHHSCMSCRGVKQQNTTMVTSSILGAIRLNPDLRAEFLSLCK